MAEQVQYVDHPPQHKYISAALVPSATKPIEDVLPVLSAITAPPVFALTIGL
jgi:hypothetical protein